MIRARALTVVLLAASLGACTSVTVRHVTPHNERTVCGTRYYLPQPFVVATPKADGSLAVKVEYLPDPTQQYAVCTWSAFATHDLTLKLTQGMLSEVKWVADSSAVAAESVKAAGEVQKASIEARIEAEKAKQAKTEERAEERRTDRRDAAVALRNALDAAKIAAAEAQAAYAAVEDDKDVSPVDKAKARAARDAADAKVTELEQQCAAIRCKEVGSLTGGSVLRRNTREQVNVFEPTRAEMPGPVMFRVVPDASNGVRLEPVVDSDGEAQRVYGVYSVTGASTDPPPSSPTALKVEPTDLKVVDVGAEPQKRTLEFNKEYHKEFDLIMRNVQTNVPAKPAELPVPKVLNNKQLELTFTNATPPGRYEIQLTLKDPNKPTARLGQVVVLVEIARP